MFTLKAKFESDWIAYLKDSLIREHGWGAAEVSTLNDFDISTYYFESLHRRLVARPRKLKIASDFRCPASETVGWTLLQEKVRKGDDLNPHLSQGHASLRNRDGLLAEWGVHHFHLGTKPYPKNPPFIERTGFLVYALLDDETFWAINVYPHGVWENVNIIEAIHENWPDITSKYRVVGVTGTNLADKERRSLRQKSGNVFVSMNDGTVYMPIGGAIMASGVKFESVRSSDIWRDRIITLQTTFERQLNKLIPLLKQHGYSGDGEIEAQLIIDSSGYRVVFPKYGVLANLQIDQGFFPKVA